MHRVAIYGLEGHEELVMDAVANRKDAALVAIASHNAEALRAHKANAAVTAETHVYEDWPEMLDAEKIDVIAVCSENDKHVDAIVAAAERGIHVMTEKPVAVSWEGLNRIREAAGRSGIAFSTLFEMRMSPPFAAMREAVRAGDIGKPISIFAQKSYKLGVRPEWMKHRKSFGGIIPYVGCHMLDLAMWITGLDVKRVAAFHGNAGKPDVREMEDHAAVALEMTGGAAMSMSLDYLRPTSAPTHGDTRLRIAGSAGRHRGQGPRDADGDNRRGRGAEGPAAAGAAEHLCGLPRRDRREGRACHKAGRGIPGDGDIAQGARGGGYGEDGGCLARQEPL